MRRWAPALLLLAAAPALAAQPDDERLELDDALAVVHELADANRLVGSGARDALAAPLELCASAGCDAHGLILLEPEETAELRRLMADSADPRTERRRIAQAVAQVERWVGPRNGTDHDHAANDRRADDEPGQLDCVAETVNTLALLERLAMAGLLRHHRVGGIALRYTILLQHMAVELVERESGERWVVDSWPGASGEEPVVEPYWDWRWEWQV